MLAQSHEEIGRGDGQMQEGDDGLARPEQAMLLSGRPCHLDDGIGAPVNFGGRIDHVRPAVAIGLIAEAGSLAGPLLNVDRVTAAYQR